MNSLIAQPAAPVNLTAGNAVAIASAGSLAVNAGNGVAVVSVAGSGGSVLANMVQPVSTTVSVGSGLSAH